MKKTTKIWLGISIVAVVAIVVVLIVLQPWKPKEPEVIKIGAILPLTGDGAAYGEEAKNAIELALDELNKDNIFVIYEDDQGTSNGAINAFNKLVEIDNVPVIIGPMYSSTALAVAPLAEDRNIVVFSPAASSPKLTKAGDYFFRNWPSDTYEGTEIAKFSYNSLKLRNIGIISVNLDYGLGLTEVFKNQFEELGGRILGIEFYDQGATDFRNQLSKIKGLNCDGIYLPGYYSEIGLILRQAHEMGINDQFLSCVGFDNPKVLEIANGSAEGLYFARPYYQPESKDPLVKDFVRKYKGNYGTLPGVYAAHAYDALRIVVEAIKNGGYTSEGIRDAIYNIKDFPGVSGNTSFDENGDVIKPIQIMKVEKGIFVNVQN